MPAWKHTASWNDALYDGYRKFVSVEAPKQRGNTEMDCADLSTLLLIRYAAANGLGLDFTDGGGTHYRSYEDEQDPSRWIHNKDWSNVDDYIDAVTDRLGTEALWKANTEANSAGPQPGDLMINYRSGGMHHTALVFRVFARGMPHPQANNQSVIDFPADTPDEDGDDIAIRQPNTEYFRDRDPNSDQHFDYLNHRSNRKKAGAELIYFARVSDMKKDGFQFRKWASWVLMLGSPPPSEDGAGAGSYSQP